MTKGLPWYHLWHSWSDWTKPDFDFLRLTIAGHQGHIKIRYRRCVDCGRIQLREML